MQYDEKTLKEEIYKYVRNLNTNERKKRLEILRGEFNHYDYRGTECGIHIYSAISNLDTVYLLTLRSLKIILRHYSDTI